MLPGSHPILSPEAAGEVERTLFNGDEAKEWPAMQRAGRAIAAAVVRDFAELGGFPANAEILVLAGKGHNAGDAFIAAHALLEKFPATRARILFALGERTLRPLAARAWRALSGGAGDRVTRVSPGGPVPRASLCLDGVFGFQFRPPAEPGLANLFARVNAAQIALRAAVDLPSAGLFRADFTYATGSVKTPVLDATQGGRVRYLDLGFFADGAPGDRRVITPAILAPLAALRPAQSDKRRFGHLFVMGGCRGFPGAVLMSVLAAVRSGAGLVTAFVPESLVPAFAARVPEAMWVGWPETPAGSLALEGEHLWRARVARADALLLGPGLGREAETLALAESVATTAPVALVLDADALQPSIVRAGRAARVLTPHAGEYARIAGEAELPAFARETGATVVLKGPATRIGGPDAVYHSFFGGPVLARGGSGDLLAGLIGGLLAQTPGDPLLAAARGATWHGLAADALARTHGQVAVHTTQLLDFLAPALRELADAQ